MTMSKNDKFGYIFENKKIPRTHILDMRYS